MNTEHLWDVDGTQMAYAINNTSVNGFTQSVYVCGVLRIEYIYYYRYQALYYTKRYRKRKYVQLICIDLGKISRFSKITNFCKYFNGIAKIDA